VELDEEAGKELGQVGMVPEDVAGGDEPSLCQMNFAPQGIAMGCTGHGCEDSPEVSALIVFILLELLAVSNMGYGYHP
jgi:hypothetical protein